MAICLSTHRRGALRVPLSQEIVTRLGKTSGAFLDMGVERTDVASEPVQATPSNDAPHRHSRQTELADNFLDRRRLARRSFASMMIVWVPGRRVACHGRRRWALCVRRAPMMPWPTTRSNR